MQAELESQGERERVERTNGKERRTVEQRRHGGGGQEIDDKEELMLDCLLQVPLGP